MTTKQQAAGKQLTCPDFISPEAKKEWRRVSKLLAKRGTIEQLDRAVLVLYCESWAAWIAAKAKIAETGGPVVKSPNGYPIQNPYVSIASTSFNQMRAAIKELGLSPASRKRTKPSKRAIKTPQGLQLLKGGQP